MALQTDPTISGLEAYADVAYADTYFDKSRLFTSNWDSAPYDNRERALAWAALLLNNVKFKGAKVNLDETLDWPRYDVYKDKDAYVTYSSDELPIPVQHANCELALHLLEKDRTLLYEENLGLSSLSVSGINLNFDHNRKETTIPKYVLNLLKPVSHIGQMLRG